MSDETPPEYIPTPDERKEIVMMAAKVSAFIVGVFVFIDALGFPTRFLQHEGLAVLIELGFGWAWITAALIVTLWTVHVQLKTKTDLAD